MKTPLTPDQAIVEPTSIARFHPSNPLGDKLDAALNHWMHTTADGADVLSKVPSKRAISALRQLLEEGVLQITMNEPPAGGSVTAHSDVPSAITIHLTAKGVRRAGGSVQ